MVNKQDYFNAFNQNIDMVRGDTLAFCFEIAGLDDYSNLDFTFNIAEHHEDDPFISLSLGEGIELLSEESGKAIYSVGVAPELTAGLELGRYFYDLRLIDEENVITLLRGYLTLVWEV